LLDDSFSDDGNGICDAVAMVRQIRS